MIVANLRHSGRLLLVLASGTCLAAIAETASAQSAAAPAPVGGAALAGASVPAAAEDTDIIVTAQRREQRLQDVPISITAVSGDQLANRGVIDTSQIGRIAPGVQITAYGSSPTITAINIRGVAQLDYADHQESPNAVYLDGAYVSFQGATGIGLYDVDRLEVLRGPQGTLFGRNATGGLVQVISRKPTDETEGYIQGSYGRYDQARIEGAVGGAVAEGLSARASLLFNRQDGYINNVSGRDGGADKTINGRFQLRWRPSATVDNNLEVFGSRTFRIGGGVYDTLPGGPDPDNHGFTTVSSGPIFENNCAALGYGVPPAGSNNCLGYIKPKDGPFKVDAPSNGSFRRAIWGVTDTLVWNLDWATLTSIANYSHIRKFYQEDSDSSPFVIATYNSGQVAHQASGELRLNGGNGPFRWTVGGYYLHIFGRYDVGLDFADSFGFTAGNNYRQKVDTFAVFGQAEYDLTSQLTAIGGLRWTRDIKKFSLAAVCGLDDATCVDSFLAPTGAVTSGSYKRNDWSGKAQLTYKISPAALLYAGVTRGNKGSLLQAPSVVGLDTPFSALVVKPEVLTAYEGGIKTTLLDRRLTANLGGFYYRYHNFQAFNFVNLSGAIFNAEARNYGAEFELNANLGNGLSANAGLAYLHTRVRDVSLPDGTRADQQSVFSPKYSANGSVRKEFRSNLGIFFVQPSVNYASSRYFSTINSPALKAPGFVAADVSLGILSLSRSWDATVFFKNVTNKHYITYATDLTSLGGLVQRNFAMPRAVSLQIGYRF